MGRYALGVDWTDGHGSIYPFEHLRQACPCGACADVATPGTPATWPQEIKKQDDSLRVVWADTHESVAAVHRAARPLPLRRLYGRSLMDERAKRLALLGVMLSIFLAAMESHRGGHRHAAGGGQPGRARHLLLGVLRISAHLAR